MKAAGIIFTGLLLMASGCRQSPDHKQIVEKSDSLSLIAERIEMDFPYTEKDIDQQLEERLGNFAPEEKTDWEEKNWLEWRIINGEKRYFSRAVSNLSLLRSFYYDRAERDSLEASDPEMIFRKNHTQAIIKESGKDADPAIPISMTIIYTLTVLPDAVPAGETVRCWLPYPKENHLRQQNVKLLSTSAKEFIIAPDSALHRTVYFEEQAEKGVPLVFKVSYSYESSGQYFNPDEINIDPYNAGSDFYLRYTSEEPPHICFTEKVRNLADSITSPGDNPVVTVRKFCLWFNANVPWTGAMEYSIIPNIPEYVIQNRRGDCGMQTFLLMSMLRYKGVPVRWQSGWKVPPGAKNLHDWCEVYFEGTGWVPVDISYGLQYSENKETREFYISGIDSYRLIINDGVAGRLYPHKIFLRSEPYDFQRGEVEWDGGNLYFDKWDYNMEIKYN